MIAQESAPGIMTEEFRCTVGLPGDVDSPQSIKGRTVPEGRTALFGEEALDISTDITVMENLLAHLKTKAFQSRTIALMENGTWAPMAAKLMRAELDGMKNITVCDTVVTLRSASNAAAEAQMDAMVDELLNK